jgi:EAL and modified HD-GYP domain-containing signal transduction protein
MELFIARQPIFDNLQKVYAYELLFRSGLENAFPDVDPNLASARVIADSLFNLGLKEITGEKKAFINLTRDLLVRDYAFLLPKDRTVIELLETIKPEGEVIAACRRLKKAGYTIALDDFTDSGEMAPLVALADLIKVDFLATKGGERGAVVARHAPRGVTLLAEKVETQEEFQKAAGLGYRYFQGYFFARPSMLRATSAPEFRLTYLNLFQEITSGDIDTQRVASIIGRDVTLSYKLLLYINSSFFGFRREVSSIAEAIRLLGERELKRWASLIVLASLAASRPAELVVEAALRAKFCETLAVAAGLTRESEDLFFLGLFSLIDAILDRPLDAILEELPLPARVKSTLLGAPGPLRDVYDCVLAYVAGDWPTLSPLIGKLRLQEEDVPRFYREALQWSHQALGGASEQAPPAKAA